MSTPSALDGRLISKRIGKLIMVKNLVYLILAFYVGIGGFVHRAEAKEPVLSEKELSNLQNELCNVLHVATITEDYDAAADIETRLLRFSDISLSDLDYKLQLANFFNSVSDTMICSASNGRYPNQHIFKRAFELNIHADVLNGYFFSDETGFPIDPSVVEIMDDGRRSTLLDYIDSVIRRPDAAERYNLGEVVGITRILEQLYDGKRAREL